MVLADTTIWIDHLRHGDRRLVDLLQDGLVASHPFVVGELSLGSLRHRRETLHLLRRLPQAVVATDDEVALLIEGSRLFSRGIGYVDAHLVASVRLTPEVRLWTRDRRLHSVANDLSIAF